MNQPVANSSGFCRKARVDSHDIDLSALYESHICH